MLWSQATRQRRSWTRASIWSIWVSTGCGICRARERVFQVRGGVARAVFGGCASLDAFPGNLPVQVRRFVGRRDGGRSSRRHAGRASPVVTLTGVGGVGKTRLALQVRARCFPGSATARGWSSWPRCATRTGVADAVAATFGVRPGRARRSPRRCGVLGREGDVAGARQLRAPAGGGRGPPGSVGWSSRVPRCGCWRRAARA